MDFDNMDLSVFQTKASQAKPKQPKPAATMSTTSSKPAWKIEKMVDGETGKPLVFTSREDAQRIVAGRVSMRLSQKDLAIRLNMQLKDLQEIETCRAVDNRNTIDRILRYLARGKS